MQVDRAQGLIELAEIARTAKDAEQAERGIAARHEGPLPPAAPSGRRGRPCTASATPSPPNEGHLLRLERRAGVPNGETPGEIDARKEQREENQQARERRDQIFDA